MHDPLVVAWDIPAPWLRRSSILLRPGAQRWGVRTHRRTNPENLGERVYPWWRPKGYRLALAGREYRTRTLVIIWHVEPNGHDSGEVCRHYFRGVDGKYHPDGSWRWHVHHWRLQVPGLQALRRRLLTRCAWCGGRERRGRPVNVALSWDQPRGHWWQSEPNLFHSACSAVARAHRECPCADPGPLDHGDYGTCAQCGRFRAWRQPGAPDRGDAIRALQSVPAGQAPSFAVMEFLASVNREGAP